MYPQWTLTVGEISGPTLDLEYVIGTILPLWIHMVGKKHSGRADSLILANGGSEHA